MLQSKLLHIPARLACVRHAASVRPEPGSNSRVKSCIESRKCYLSSSKLISELTVFLDMTRENHVRVLLDSVSFSRIICQPLACRLALTAQLVYCALRFLSSTFSNFFRRKSTGCAIGCEISRKSHYWNEYKALRLRHPLKRNGDRRAPPQLAVHGNRRIVLGGNVLDDG